LRLRADVRAQRAPQREPGSEQPDPYQGGHAELESGEREASAPTATAVCVAGDDATVPAS
jgi:hypothetical protein